MTMQACVRAPHYLSWNGHFHTFRMAVPRDLKDAVGKREIKKSLLPLKLRGLYPALSCES